MVGSWKEMKRVNGGQTSVDEAKEMEHVVMNE